MIEVELPDGSIAEFPAGTSPETIKAALRKRFGAPQPATPVVPRDTAQPNPLLREGPGPGGIISEDLYRMGAIGRRMTPEVQSDIDQRLAGLEGDTRNAGTRAADRIAEAQMAQAMREGQMRRNRAAPSSRLEAGLLGAAQGVTMGLNDEIAGAILGPQARDFMRDRQDVGREQFPGTTLAGEVGGSLLVPAVGGGTATSLTGAVARGGLTGAGYAGAYAAGQAEGGIESRMDAAAEAAQYGLIFGAAAPVAINFGSRAFRNLATKAQERPTIEALRGVKNAAYSAVDSAGVKFPASDLQGVYQRVQAELAQGNYVPEVDRQTFAALKLLENASTRDASLGQLDRIRQGLWARYNAAPNEVGIRTMIDEIDNLINASGPANDLMLAARVANQNYKKAELLEDAFIKAQDQTAATGSGGNILNKYRQAVTAIINDPKRAKWFTAAEVEQMRAFVQGSVSENVLRRIGKLAPSGNGLMLALNLGAASVSPAMLGVTAAASGAKAIADRKAVAGAEDILRMVSGQGSSARQPVGYTNAFAPAAGVLGAQ